jgi:hypothetical protein
MPWEIYLACSDGESINFNTYHALHTDVDLDGLYDLLELQEVHESWRHARVANERERA